MRAWRATRATALGAEADRLDVEVFASAWASGIARPPDPHGYVALVAVAGGTVVGFAAAAPTDVRPDAPSEPGEVPPPRAAEIIALEVEPTRTGEGHGSRLLAACVDTVRASGAEVVRTWVLEDDGARAGFLRSAGLSPDGSHRVLDVGGRRVREDSWSARF